MSAVADTSQGVKATRSPIEVCINTEFRGVGLARLINIE